MTDTVLLSIDGPRATITLNDPAKHNRLNTEGLGKLHAAIEKADADPDVRVTVLTGTGEKTFCSGYDLGSIPSGKDAKPSSETARHSFETVMDRLEAMRMPTLCALNGGVYGGATDMALACDFRLGVKGMRFFMPAARFGLHYYPSGLRRYTQKVSPSFAKRAFLLSEDFSDEDLLRVGYLDWLVDRADFARKVDETAAKLGGLAPLSMANMKRAIEQFAQAEPDIPKIRDGIRECQTSEDLREGLTALREKRTPAFKGR
jgi:enoyl-CoA hydratase